MRDHAVNTNGTGTPVAAAPPASAPTDEDLAAGVASGDAAAFGLLYDRYARPVYALAVHLLGTADAEEAVQEVFLLLWQRADRYDRARGPFRPWFMAVARHQTLRQLRRRAPARLVVAAEEIDRAFALVIDRRIDVEDEARRREEAAAILRALAVLPPEQRRALVLAYFGGLSQTAIAQHLGWPLGTVKKRTRLGLQKLRAALVGFGPTGTAPSDRSPAPSARADSPAPAHARATTEHDDDGL